MIKKIVALIIGLTSFFYILNPSAGVLELIPDNLPVAGNLDEVVATAIIISVLRMFDIDLTKKLSPPNIQDENTEDK